MYEYIVLWEVSERDLDDAVADGAIERPRARQKSFVAANNRIEALKTFLATHGEECVPQIIVEGYTWNPVAKGYYLEERN